MKNVALIAAFILAVTATANAAISIDVSAYCVETKAGNGDCSNPIFFSEDGGLTCDNDGQLLLLIADTGDKSFADTLNAIQNNTGFVGGDDTLVGAFSANFDLVGVDGYIYMPVVSYNNTAAGVEKDDLLLMVWFEDVQGSTKTQGTDLQPGATPGASQNYGFYADATFVMPDNSGTHFIDVQFTGAQGVASSTTVPEPASMILLAIGGGLLAARRRKA